MAEARMTRDCTYQGSDLLRHVAFQCDNCGHLHGDCGGAGEEGAREEIFQHCLRWRADDADADPPEAVSSVLVGPENSPLRGEFLMLENAAPRTVRV